MGESITKAPKRFVWFHITREIYLLDFAERFVKFSPVNFHHFCCEGSLVKQKKVFYNFFT